MRQINGLLLFLALLVPLNAYGQSAETGPRPGGLELGYRLINFDYEESLMEEKGLLNGIFAGYTHRAQSGLMLSAEVEYFYGELDYDGQYQNGTPLEADTDDHLFQVRGLIGWDFFFRGWTITPYTGLGWRYWNDRIHAVGGYEREIRYFYAPFGFEFLNSPAPAWLIGFTAEYDLFLDGQADANFSDIGPGYEDASMDQNFGEGYGVRFSAAATYAFEKFSLTLEPFFRYWDIEESDTDAAAVPNGTVVWVEPENETTIYGFGLSIGF
jgi:hypothetical protein